VKTQPLNEVTTMLEWEARAEGELRVSKIGRRSFLEALQVGVGGLMLGLGSEPAQAATLPHGQSVAGAGAGFSPNVFLHVAPDGWVTVVCHRSEMGQGVRSTLPVLFADELGADIARVRVRQADGDAIYGDQNTDSSSSIRGHYELLRRLAATARTVLVRVGARQLGVKAAECTAREHQVCHAASGRSVDFGHLALLAEREPLPRPEAVALRPDAELRRIGTDLPLLDAKAYVTGTALFGADVRLPGMLTAVIERPPVVGGKVLGFDATAARAIAGVRHVVAMPEPERPYAFQPWGGVAVVAEDTWAALRGRKVLAVRWDDGENRVYDSPQYKAALEASVGGPGTVARQVGDVEAAFASAARRLDAEYYVPHLPHAPMEPPVAVAHVQGDNCEIWAPTQNPQAARKEAARVLGVPEANVTVHVTFLGGAFGRKSKADFVAEAVWLAREVKAPVRVQWTREDDIRHDYYNTVSYQRLSAGLDARGKVIAWHHRSAFPPLDTVFGGSSQPSPRDLLQGVCDVALAVPNVLAEACEAPPARVRIGWLRSVYNVFHAFSTNCFIDEIAAARAEDSLDVRLEIHGPPRQIDGVAELGISVAPRIPLSEYPVDVARLRGVIERVAENSGWRARKAHGRALGLAAHRCSFSYAAAVVSVIRAPSGKLAVDEVWVALDAGKIINLDRVRAQVEGSVIFGMSLALHGGTSMKAGVTEQTNFRDLRQVRIGAAPRAIHVDVVQSDQRPGGAGEPAVPPIAPAIANAVFALTGQRVRELPLSHLFG
jgi:isoquinoline 1-oxidoreductase beta subunit